MFDLRRERRGVRVVQDHPGRAPHPRRHHSEHQHVEDGVGQRGALTVVGRRGMGLEGDEARPHQVVLAVDGPLRPTRGARRVGDRRRCVGVVVDGGRRVGIGRAHGAEPVVEGEVAAPGARADPVDDLGGGDEDARRGVVEQVPLLGCGQRLVDAEPDPAGQERPEEPDRQLGAVGQRPRHPVAGPHAELVQHGGHPPGLGPQLGSAPRAVTVDQREAGRVAGVGVVGVGVEEVGDQARSEGIRVGRGATGEPGLVVDVDRHAPGQPFELMSARRRATSSRKSPCSIDHSCGQSS